MLTVVDISPLQFLLYDRHRRRRHVLVGSDCLATGTLAKQLLAEP